ncbi:putative peptidoglycan binding protein [Palleronia aestuarii]|uniref:Putative peptidoglycan binding protein n=1 Tax=Palleronia aestuarii TaxID=568105 RepID=A0A2W7NIS2_9RHOB|nr:peptidoglycan-binding domain-containing protein [Palleronia aestuarii]PZX16594.1 putative peptidoglycan binding protein [Palleronia aestuarii]
MRMLAILCGFVLGMVGTQALAASAALVVANGTYADGSQIDGVDAIVAAASAFAGSDVDLEVVEDATRPAITEALGRFAEKPAELETRLVILAGKFVRTGRETYLLAQGAEVGDVWGAVRGGVPVSEVLDFLSGGASQGVLFLASPQGEAEEIAPGLMGGIAMLDIPADVTVIRGAPERIAALMPEVLRPGSALAQRIRAGTAQGDISDDTEPTVSADDLTDGDPTADEIEEAFWRLTEVQDDAAGYRAYLDRYGDGPHAREAQARLAALADTADGPRLREAALGLDPAARRAVQRNLVLLGDGTGGVDGIFGPGTRTAIRSWQSANDLPPTGFLDSDQIATLEAQSASRAADLEAEEQGRLEAERQEEAAYWRETGEGRDIDGLEAFLERYPQGRYAAKARERLSDLRDARIDTDGMSKEEQDMWQAARDAGTIAAYEAYANAYPRGRYANRVRQELAALRLASNAPPGDSDAAAAEAELGLTPLTRRAVEDRLVALDLAPGAVDGTFDAETRDALRRYQEGLGVPVTGYLDAGTARRLLTDSVTQ